MTADPICDLVLLTWNRADLLKPCVERVLRHTRVPSRLLIVDNASTDADAVAYLEELGRSPGTERVEVTVIRRLRNDGFAIGMNDGIGRTTAPWICLLNNDILVTEGWLEELLHVAQANPQIGLLNPMSNEFNIGPMDPAGPVDEVGAEGRRHHGRWIEHYMGVGFCVLFPRQVVGRVGVLDVDFEFLYAEDRDYSMRVQRAGWICAIAEGAYVFHHRQSTMKRNPALSARLRENQERFFRKWNKEWDKRIAYVVSPRAAIAPTADRIRQMANEGHSLWAFYVRKAQAAVPRHFIVRPQPSPSIGFSAYVLWRILTKKKRFDRIIVTSRRLAAVLRALRFLHRADVIVAA